MALELITVKTADGIELDGGMYQPTEPPRHGARVLMVHGLTWNFYRGPSRWLPSLLAAAGYPCLSLNMRDHDQTEAKDFELAQHDLRAGIDYLAAPGDEVILLAHGYACNKVVCYPGWSGDHRVQRRILTTLGAVKGYRPDIWATVLRLAPALQGKTLVVQGAIDPLIQAQQRADELTVAATQSRVEVVLLEGADHYFNDRHEALATRIATWLATSVGRPERSVR
jgi:predicted alpha/beta hydrolase